MISTSRLSWVAMLAFITLLNMVMLISVKHDVFSSTRALSEQLEQVHASIKSLRRAPSQNNEPRKRDVYAGLRGASDEEPTPEPTPPPAFREKHMAWASLSSPAAPPSHLPRIGVMTINAQPHTRSLGTSSRASWMHRISYHNKKTYCEKWGYDLIIEDIDVVNRTRDVAWSKIPAFRKWLPKYQWIMWVDMDALFMEYHIDLTRFIDDKYDVVIGKDWNGINMGVYFMKNTPYNFQLMEEMWDAPRTFWHPWEEQSTLMAIWNPAQNPYARQHALRVHVVDQHAFNSYPTTFVWGHYEAAYRNGDFLVHFPNCKGVINCKGIVTELYVTVCRRNRLAPLGEADDVPHKVIPARYKDTVEPTNETLDSQM